jgi:hypothetical protein
MSLSKNRRSNMKRLTLVTAFTLVAVFTHSATAAPQADCKAIDAALSATEDYVELALAGDATGTAGAKAEALKTFAAVSRFLPADTQQGAATRLQAMAEIPQGAAVTASSLSAMDVYADLAKAFKDRLPTTLDVAMMDHAGFELEARLASNPIDWDQMSQRVTEANSGWTRSANMISDKGLKDVLTSVHVNLETAVAAHNPAWARLAAQLLLDSVDLVERQVKNTSHHRCS